MPLICEYCRKEIHLGLRFVADLGRDMLDVGDPYHLPHASEKFPFHGRCFAMWAYDRLKNVCGPEPATERPEPEDFKFLTTGDLAALGKQLTGKMEHVTSTQAKYWLKEKTMRIDAALAERAKHNAK